VCKKFSKKLGVVFWLGLIPTNKIQLQEKFQKAVVWMVHHTESASTGGMTSGT